MTMPGRSVRGRERTEETTMDLGSNTILITGGMSGIGLALAEQFLRAGSEGIVRGRREELETLFTRMGQAAR